MSITTQLKQKGSCPVFDSGMELIWFLEDAYEQKDAEKFLSIVSSEFKKGFLRLKAKLEEDFSQSSKLDLYILLLSRDRDLDKDECLYEICWSKRVKKIDDDYWQREFGKATIVVKRYSALGENNFLVQDIRGDDPFCSP
jgi:hypothetical protein